MSIRQKSIRGLFWSAAQSWGNQVITLLVVAVLARLLSPSAFGLVALANVFVAFTKIFIDQGFAMAIIQRRDLEPAHLSTAFWSNVTVGIALMVIGLLAAGGVAQVFGEPQLTPIVRWLSIVFLVSSLSAVQQALLKRDFGFKVLAIRSLVATVIGGIVGVSMAVTGWGVWSLVGQQVTFNVVQVILLWTISNWRPSFGFSVPHFRDLLAYGANIVGINVAEFLSRNADKFLIGYYLGAVALGYYAIAYKLLETMARLFAAVSSQVVFSSFAALQAEVERLRRAFYTATRLTGVITFPLFTGLAVVASGLVALLFGPQWQESVPVVRILVFAGLLESIFLYNANVMLAMGKPSWRLWINIVNALVNLLAFAIAVRWGIVAVAAAYVIRAYLLSPIPLVLVRRLIGIDIRHYLANFAVPAAATLLMAALVYLVQAGLTGRVGNTWNLALSITTGALVYAISVSVLSPSLLSEAKKILRGRRGAAAGMEA